MIDVDDSGEAVLVECPNCGELRDESEDVEVEVFRQTHWSPAEYMTFCQLCLPVKYREPDPDRYRD